MPAIRFALRYSQPRLLPYQGHRQLRKRAPQARAFCAKALQPARVFSSPLAHVRVILTQPILFCGVNLTVKRRLANPSRQQRFNQVLGAAANCCVTNSIGVPCSRGSGRNERSTQFFFPQLPPGAWPGNQDCDTIKRIFNRSRIHCGRYPWMLCSICAMSPLSRGPGSALSQFKNSVRASGVCAWMYEINY